MTSVKHSSGQTMDVGQHVWILAATYPNPLNYPTALQFGVMYEGQRAVLGW